MSWFTLDKVAASATMHCLTGCAIGEVLGLVVGTALGLSAVITVLLAIVLAFLFGYGLSTLPLVKHGLPLQSALWLVLAADTLSILTMEAVDNLVMVVIPGAITAGLTDLLFWLSLALSLVAAFFAAYPVNKYLLSKGRGHALLHAYHGDQGTHSHGTSGDH